MSLAHANRAELLKRLPPKHALHAVLSSAIDAVHAFDVKRGEISTSMHLTEAGKRDALRQATPDAVKAIRDARASLKSAKEAVARRRGQLKHTGYDPANAAAAIERSEIRSYLRGLSPMALTVIADTSDDPRILEAMLSAPPELSGFTDQMKQVAERAELRYLKILNGNVVDDIEAEETLIADAEAVAQVVTGEVQGIAGLPDHEMAAQLGTAESTRGRPWLQRDGDRIVRVRPGEMYPPWPTATDHDVAHGVYYDNLDAYAKANGFAGAEDFKAQHKAQQQEAA